MRKIKPKVDKYMTPTVGGSLSKKKSRPIYPTFRVDLEHLPEAKEWKVGHTYKIEMEVKMVGLSQSRFDNSAEFEIRQVGTDDSDSKDLSTEESAGETPDTDDD